MIGGHLLHWTWNHKLQLQSCWGHPKPLPEYPESTNLSETYTTGQAAPTLQAYDHQGVAAKVRQTRRRATYIAGMLNIIRVATLWNNSYNGLYFTKVCADCSFSMWNYKNWINWYIYIYMYIYINWAGLGFRLRPCLLFSGSTTRRADTSVRTLHNTCRACSMLQLRHPTNPKAGCNSWQWHWWPANQRLTVGNHGSEIVTSIKIQNIFSSMALLSNSRFWSCQMLVFSFASHPGIQRTTLLVFVNSPSQQLSLVKMVLGPAFIYKQRFLWAHGMVGLFRVLWVCSQPPRQHKKSSATPALQRASNQGRKCSAPARLAENLSSAWWAASTDTL